jgi:hypothetical protein
MNAWARRAGLFVLLLALFSGCFAFDRAHAAYPAEPGWSSPAHMAPLGTLCMEHGNGKVLGQAITAAAAGWNKADVTVVAQAACTGYARPNVLKFAAAYDYAKVSSGAPTWCARFVPGTYTWTYLRGVWTWVAGTPTVQVNYAPAAVKWCQFSLAVKTNMMSHESGHWLGLSHAVGITVMGAGTTSKYTVATVYDVQRLNGRY